MKSRHNRRSTVKTPQIAETTELLEPRLLLSGDGRIGQTLQDTINQTETDQMVHQGNWSYVNHQVSVSTSYATANSNDSGSYSYQADITANIQIRGVSTAPITTTGLAHMDGQPLHRVNLDQGGDIQSGRVEYIDSVATSHINGYGWAWLQYEATVTIHETEHRTSQTSFGDSDHTVEDYVQARNSGWIYAYGQIDINITAQAMRRSLKAGVINDISGKYERSEATAFTAASGMVVVNSNNASTESSDHYYGWRQYHNGPRTESNDWSGATASNRSIAITYFGTTINGANAVRHEEQATRSDVPEWDWYRDYHSQGHTFSLGNGYLSWISSKYETTAEARDYMRQDSGQQSQFGWRYQPLSVSSQSYAENPGSSPAATESSQSYARTQFDGVFAQFPSTLEEELMLL